MGRPPKRVVLNKLVRRYFKNQVNQVYNAEGRILKDELISCWEKHGVDHPKCVHLVPKYDHGMALDMAARQRYRQQVKQYPAIFQNMLQPQINKMYFKGTDSKGYWMMNAAEKMPKY